jgi:hypothetical protein
MNTATFESKLMPDGHLYCPEEYCQKKNAQFKVIVIFEENTETEASEHDAECAAANDNATDFLSREELSYYFSLKEL